MTIPGVDATVALVDRRRGRRLSPVRGPGRLVSLSRAEPAGAPVRRSARRATGGSPSTAARTRAGCSSKPPGSPSAPPGRCARSMSGSARGAGCRSPSSRPPASSPCSAGTWSIKDEDYAFARPSLTEKKLRALELRAGMPSRRGKKGKAAAHNLTEVRRRELELSEQAEHAYRQLVADWQANAPAKKSGVAAANGTRLKRPSAGQAARQASVPEPALRSGVDHAHARSLTPLTPGRKRRRPAARIPHAHDPCRGDGTHPCPVSPASLPASDPPRSHQPPPQARETARHP